MKIKSPGITAKCIALMVISLLLFVSSTAEAGSSVSVHLTNNTTQDLKTAVIHHNCVLGADTFNHTLSANGGEYTALTTDTNSLGPGCVFSHSTYTVNIMNAAGSVLTHLHYDSSPGNGKIYCWPENGGQNRQRFYFSGGAIEITA